MSISLLKEELDKLIINIQKKNDGISIDKVIDYINKLNIIFETQSIDEKEVDSFTHSEINDLTKTLQNLDKTQQIEVFKIIHSQCKYSENSNGIFINMTSLNNDVLTQLKNLANYFINKNKKLEEENIFRNNILDNVNNDTAPHEYHDNKDIKKIITNDNFENNILRNGESDSNDKIDSNITIDETKILQEEFDVYNELALSSKYTKTSSVGARIIKKCRELNRNLEE